VYQARLYCLLGFCGPGDNHQNLCFFLSLFHSVEIQMKISQSIMPNAHDPSHIRNLALSTDLSLLITKDKHWAAAALRCRSHPHEAREAMEVKVRGAYTAKITPLHYACENQPSVEVIKTLIHANPSALERRQEPGGQLPLHAACTWGASSGVIQELLLALPSCAEMKDFLSNLPLHCACYSGADTKVVESLLRVYPQSVWPRNHQGSSAVDIVRRLSHSNRREVLGLLERTMSRLLERASAVEEEGVEVDQ
jgi:ankyrin repeat protein